MSVGGVEVQEGKGECGWGWVEVQEGKGECGWGGGAGG